MTLTTIDARVLFWHINSLRHHPDVDAAYKCRSGADRCTACAADFDSLAHFDSLAAAVAGMSIVRKPHDGNLLVEVTPELFDAWGTRTHDGRAITVAIGETRDGITDVTFTATDDGMFACSRCGTVRDARTPDQIDDEALRREDPDRLGRGGETYG